jgi:hypothetical protein
VAYICDSSYLGGRDQEDHLLGPGKKFTRHHFNQELGAVANSHHYKLQGVLRSRELWFQASQGKKSFQDPISMEKSWVWWCVPVISTMTGSVK